MRVTNKVQKAEKYRGQIKLTTNYPEKPELLVRISGNIRALLEVRPKVLSFGKMSEERLQQLKSTNKLMKRPVVVLLNKGNDLQIEKVELAKSLFKVVKQEQWRGRRIQFMVEPVLEKLKKGPNADILKVYTNQKDKEVLEVPVQFELL
jgi:ribosome-binding ATPase YchF (GTP1/OBG family)